MTDIANNTTLDIGLRSQTMSDTLGNKDQNNNKKELEQKKLRRMRMIRSLLPIVGLFLVFFLFNFLTDGKMMAKLPLAMSQVYVRKP